MNVASARPAPRRTRRLTCRVLVRQSREGSHPTPPYNERVQADCYFQCPTLTPLWYTPGYRQLDEDGRRLYNQLTALISMEVIEWFEVTFLPVLTTVSNRLESNPADKDLVDALRCFADDEREHIGWWRSLHAASVEAVGLEAGTRLMRIRPLGRWVLDRLAHSSRWLSAVYWVMLSLEEHSLEIARRTLSTHDHPIDPRHREAHRQHQRDEARHVQLDWHLIDRLYSRQPSAIRKLNAVLFGSLLTRYLLPPVRVGCEVIDHLVRLRPDLSPHARTLKRQLHAVGAHPDYRAMMYSPYATPILFTLFDTYPEMAGLAKRLRATGNAATEAHAAC